MSFLAYVNNITIIELEVNERINDKFLNEFISTNLDLKNINLGKNQKIFVNYIESIKEYQVFIVDKKFKYFEYELILNEYEDYSFFAYSLFICEDFFVIFKAHELFYLQKLNKDIKEHELLAFIKKKFNIEFECIKKLNHEEMKTFEHNFKNKYKKDKDFRRDLKAVNLSKNFNFIIYLSYVFIILIITILYFKYEIEQNSKTKYIDSSALEKELQFNGFTNELYKIIESIELNGLKLVALDFQIKELKILVEAESKDSISEFLNNFNKIEQSSIDYVSDRALFRATIDVELFK